MPPSSIDLDASTSSDGSVLDDPVVGEWQLRVCPFAPRMAMSVHHGQYLTPVPSNARHECPHCRHAVRGSEYALSAGLKKHLLGHSSEGYYVPIEMPSGPLYDASGALPGGYLGSSQALMEELIELTPKLGIG